jgi:sec-independent protein translocase protein TatB
MFNFGVTEVMIIAIVGLIVIGPERLPRVARTLGHLFGRMQRYVSDIKADINREVELDELRKLQSTMKEAAQEIGESVSKQVNFIEDEVQQAGAETRKSVEEAVQPAAGINLMHSLNPPDHPEDETGKPEDGVPEEPAPQIEPGTVAKSSSSVDKSAGS